MKVMLINGSPDRTGCCNTALDEIDAALQADGIDVERIWVGMKPISGCIDCRRCRDTHRCIINDDVPDAVERFKQCDGLMVASPVHFASASGAATSFLDRFFFSANRDDLRGKPGAAIVSCRRGGATAAFDQLNKYFSITEMPIVTSCYWNQVHGSTPDEVRQDLEGMHGMRVLAHNMAYLLKALQAAREAGVPLPKQEPMVFTNFIR